MFFFRLTGTSQGEGVSLKPTIFKEKQRVEFPEELGEGVGFSQTKKKDLISSKGQMF